MKSKGKSYKQKASDDFQFPIFASQNFGVKVYDLEARSLEDIIKKSKFKAKYNEEAKNFTQLIEHLEFPISSSCLSLTSDGKYLWASGIYPPQIHCYELDQLTLKFSRNLDCEVVKITPLSSDYRKVALLGTNREVLLHAQFGAYDSFRLPRVGRDMVYHDFHADLLVVGSSPQVYRFNFERGMFKTPWQCESPGISEINCIQINPVHELTCVGCSNGFVECFDPRSTGESVMHLESGDLNVCHKIETSDPAMDTQGEVTCVSFGMDGISLAVGTRGGQVGLFDLRKADPIYVKDHGYDEPIIKISYFGQQAASLSMSSFNNNNNNYNSFHGNDDGDAEDNSAFDTIFGASLKQQNRVMSNNDGTGAARILSNDDHIVTVDRKIVKVWNRHTFEIVANIEPPATINDFLLFPQSGLLMVAAERAKIKPYYLPSLGPAPRWCSFVDNITEELEETKKTTVYQDFKFVTMKQLEEWGLEDLIGTDLLRPYMHGFFIKLNLFKRIMLDIKKMNDNHLEMVDDTMVVENNNDLDQCQEQHHAQEGDEVGQLMEKKNQEEEETTLSLTHWKIPRRKHHHQVVPELSPHKRNKFINKKKSDDNDTVTVTDDGDNAGLQHHFNSQGAATRVESNPKRKFKKVNDSRFSEMYKDPDFK